MSNRGPITNKDLFIDSRDIIEREEYLREWANDFCEEVDPLTAEFSYEDFADEYPEKFAEMRALQDLIGQAEGYGDWQYGATLIRDSYFVEYAQELAEDIGAVNPSAGWPNNRIDWEAAADDLKMDYVSLDFDGVTYWMRG